MSYHYRRVKVESEGDGTLFELLVLAVLFVCTAVFLWLVTAGVAWMFRNPCGNETTFITHFKDALCFRKLPQFQERVIK